MKLVFAQITGFVALMLGLAALAVNWLPMLAWTPQVLMQQESLHTRFLLSPVADRAVCEARVRKMQDAMKKVCPSCPIQTDCARGLTPAQKALFSGQTTGTPVLRSNGIVVSYEGPDPVQALQACEATERETRASQPASDAQCHRPVQVVH